MLLQNCSETIFFNKFNKRGKARVKKEGSDKNLEN